MTIIDKQDADNEAVGPRDDHGAVPGVVYGHGRINHPRFIKHGKTRCRQRQGCCGRITNSDTVFRCRRRSVPLRGPSWLYDMDRNEHQAVVSRARPRSDYGAANLQDDRLAVGIFIGAK